MKLKDIKEWIDKLPKEFMEYDVVNAEEGIIDEEYHYRIDKPIISLGVDEDTKEIMFSNDIIKDES